MSDPTTGTEPIRPPHILVLASDTAYALLLRHLLEAAGFQITLAKPQLPLTVRAGQRDPDLVLLDLAGQPALPLQRLDALLRLQRPLLVLFDTPPPRTWQARLAAARGRLVPRAIAPDQLIFQLHDCLDRRHRGIEQLRYGDIQLDLVSFKVFRNGREIHLGPIEFRLLCHFLREPSRVYSRQQLAAAAWRKPVYVGPRTVDVHVGRLRRLLNADSGPALIRTVRGIGYALT